MDGGGDLTSILGRAFVHLGVLGLAAVLLGGVALVLAVVFALRRSGRGPFAAAMGLALVSLAIGAAGTALGYVAMENAITQLGPAVTPKDEAAGTAAARASIYLSSWLAVPGLFVALHGLLRPRPRPLEGDES